MEKKKVLVGISGGVDSAVASLFLKKKGYEVKGVFMISFTDTKDEITGDCVYVKDKVDAEKVSMKLGIELKIVNFEKQYIKKVINPMLVDYEKGLTPNPDSLCNKIIKFPLLIEEAKKMRCDYIATGHYIKKIKKGDKYFLSIPKDKNKDQSYFLYDLKQSYLKKCIFPLANYTKSEVRKIAKKNGLHNFDRKGTSGVCFVGDINLKDFLKKRIKENNGDIINSDGMVIGKHNGVMFYTIGERIRENLDIFIKKEFRNLWKKKIYIVNKDKKRNMLIVAPEKSDLLFRKTFFIRKFNFISGKPKFPFNCKVRIRHLGDLFSAMIFNENGKYICKLGKGIEGVSEGQSAVVYNGKIVVGGGEIRFS